MQLARPAMKAVRCLFGLGILALVALPSAAAARGGWDCNFEGNGSDPARYVTRFAERGNDLVETHWPVSIPYRILVDTRDIEIAVHAYDIPPTFRRDARGAATVLIFNKLTGRMRRSTVATDEADQILEGSCVRL
jgi:hypothetical protein